MSTHFKWMIIVQVLLNSIWGIVLGDASKDTDNRFPFTSVVDLLSQDVQFSTFVRSLQRGGYIQYLNGLQNFTLFAPVNSAFATDGEIGEFDIENYLIHDKVLETKQVVNKTVVFRHNVKYPVVMAQNSNGDFTVNNLPVVERDLMPNMQNASIQGISFLMPDAYTLPGLVKTVQSPKYTYDCISQLLSEIEDLDELLNNKTVLVPSDRGFRRYFSSVEIKYLLNFYHQLNDMEGAIREKWDNDLNTLLQNLVLSEMIGGSIDGKEVVSNLNHDDLPFSSNDHGSQIVVNGTDLSLHHLSNLVYDFGLAHFYDTDLSLIKKHLHFDAETYLHGLNCSNFVEEIYFRKLQRLIQNTKSDEPITIFVPEPSLDDEGGFTKPSLLYHFTEQHVDLEKDFPILNRDELFTNFYDTSFCSSNKRLGGHCQRMKITKSKNGYSINNQYKIISSKPYHVGNTLIYTINKDLQLPGDLAPSLQVLDSCAQSIHFMRNLNLLDLKPNGEGYTVFLPCFDSWNKLGLNLEYLEQNSTAANLIMRNFIINGLYYTDAGHYDKNTTNNMGEEVRICANSSKDKNQEIAISLSSVDDDLLIRKDDDIMFNQGVIHPLRSLALPNALDISLRDLIETTGNIEMLDFLKQYSELDGLLNATSSYSILVPTLSSLHHENITLNSSKLKDFLKLHIIRGNDTVNLLNCEGDIHTLLGKTLTCNRIGEQSEYLRIKDGLINEVRILNKGCSTYNSTQSCVFLIDRPISLSWIDKEKYHLALPVVAVALGVVLGTFFMVGIFCCLLAVKFGKGKHIVLSDEEDNDVQVLPESDNDSDPRQPLLADRSGNVASSHGIANGPQSSTIPGSSMDNRRINTGTADTAYSSNSTSKPIRMDRK
ncbi:uncharacterized protein KNAG_0H02310 [Huiozyma naganishii CBS 8797]|uniref:FAS1 domain-containing protein n=1 Tax=Huiozyma naganishii (strain ATCC MYA-139 / BCRC 22969 / CBS 8797 / KCTC 17520 / NBRC 10181 / NCYC 3082 / Yp74L-3) TaxID=1071383 RepID=J7R9U4_HUIN7|nr:hypothetical protein KNAG_0H02310 [Kazachstania naganishii CBS 8797]CCK71645.1 hypothetical protein KNAG_0H02310 [Kazachstania naganishii CBS 8797]